MFRKDCHSNRGSKQGNCLSVKFTGQDNALIRLDLPAVIQRIQSRCKPVF